mgnify:CR=1 FL=1
MVIRDRGMTVLNKFTRSVSRMLGKLGSTAAVAKITDLGSWTGQAAMWIAGMGKGADEAAAAGKTGVEMIEDLQKAGIIGKLKGAKVDATGGHHLLPEAFRAKFKRAGIDDIDEYKTLLLKDFHQGGCHGEKSIWDNSGGKWNAEWDAWFKQNKAPTREDVLNKPSDMLQTFKPVD